MAMLWSPACLHAALAVSASSSRSNYGFFRSDSCFNPLASIFVFEFDEYVGFLSYNNFQKPRLEIMI